jgi:hypothetical protein
VKEPILGVQEPGRPSGIDPIAGAYGWHAELVPFHNDAILQTGEPQCPIEFWEARAKGDIEDRTGGNHEGENSGERPGKDSENSTWSRVHPEDDTEKVGQ